MPTSQLANDILVVNFKRRSPSVSSLCRTPPAIVGAARRDPDGMGCRMASVAEGERQFDGGGRAAVHRSAAAVLERRAARAAARGGRGIARQARPQPNARHARSAFWSTQKTRRRACAWRPADFLALRLRTAAARAGLHRSRRTISAARFRSPAEIRSRRRSGDAAADGKGIESFDQADDEQWCVSLQSARSTCARSGRTTTTSSTSQFGRQGAVAPSRPDDVSQFVIDAATRTGALPALSRRRPSRAAAPP